MNESLATRTLQNQWYNGLSEELNIGKRLFQIFQSLSPLKSDIELWGYQDTIPLVSLTFNAHICSRRSFFEKYTEAIDLIEPTIFQSMLENDIGTENYKNWLAYSSKLNLSMNQLPLYFRNWSMINAPDVTNIGVQHLYNELYANNAKNQLLPYRGEAKKNVDYSGSYDDLIQILNNSPGKSLNFDSSITNNIIQKTWTGGSNTCIDGLWAGSGCDSALSNKFANKRVTVTTKFNSYTEWSTTPGSWYNSSYFNLMYSNKAIWGNDKFWEQFFDSNGCMQYVISSLLIADGIKVEVISDEIYSQGEQEEIIKNTASGMWPFYIPSDEDAVINEATFDESCMKITTTVQTNKPIIIGCNILKITHYLGHM